MQTKRYSFPKQEASASGSPCCAVLDRASMVEGRDGLNLWELGNSGNQLVNYREDSSLGVSSHWEFQWQPNSTQNENAAKFAFV
jgi:hypothetical protein